MEMLTPIGSGEEFTAAQMNRMLDLYERALTQAGYTPKPYPDLDARVGSSRVTASRFDCLNHALWMCGCIRRFVREQRYAKSYRWLGMVQGLIFLGGLFSIQEIREHDRLDTTLKPPVRVREARGKGRSDEALDEARGDEAQEGGAE
jgi:hypothetical protein